MPPLKFVEVQPDPHANVLLYGAAKTGKSVGAASAPGPVLYLNADSANALRMAHSLHKIDEVKIESLQTLIDVSAVLTKGEHEYESIVVDPVGEVYRRLLEGISGRALSPKIQEYGDTGTHLERFCRFLCDEPINAIFVAHETAVKDESTGGFERLPYTGTSNPAFGAKLMAMVDIIGYTGVVAGEGDSPPKYLAQLIEANGRRGGDRFGVLGSSRDVNIAEWVELARAATASDEGAEQESS